MQTDAEFQADLHYLNQLAHTMLTAHPHLLRYPTRAVESTQFWHQFGPWPHDRAGQLLTQWRTNKTLDVHQWENGQ